MSTVIKETAMSIRTWLALFILALATFTIVTTELAPVGLLTPVANGLHASEAEIGMTVSLYAWVGALSALFASVFLGNLPKKALLLSLTVILFISNVGSATVSSYEMLLAARVVGALDQHCLSRQGLLSPFPSCWSRSFLPKPLLKNMWT